MFYFKIAGALGVIVLLVSALPANALESVNGKVLITISGKVDAKNTLDAAAFDLAMLEKLPQQKFSSLTPWDDHTIKFTGPLLRDVLAAAKASGTTIKAVALNDYKTSIPFSDAQTFDMIVAHKMNGESISVRTYAKWRQNFTLRKACALFLT